MSRVGRLLDFCGEDRQRSSEERDKMEVSGEDRKVKDVSGEDKRTEEDGDTRRESSLS